MTYHMSHDLSEARKRGEPFEYERLGGKELFEIGMGALDAAMLRKNWDWVEDAAAILLLLEERMIPLRAGCVTVPVIIGDKEERVVTLHRLEPSDPSEGFDDK